MSSAAPDEDSPTDLHLTVGFEGHGQNLGCHGRPASKQTRAPPPLRSQQVTQKGFVSSGMAKGCDRRPVLGSTTHGDA